MTPTIQADLLRIDRTLAFAYGAGVIDARAEQEARSALARVAAALSADPVEPPPQSEASE